MNKIKLIFKTERNIFLQGGDKDTEGKDKGCFTSMRKQWTVTDVTSSFVELIRKIPSFKVVGKVRMRFFVA